MSCNNKNCACAKQTPPRAEMIDSAMLAAFGDGGIAAVRTALGIARGGLAGVAQLKLPPGELRTLLRAIAAVYDDRKRLQAFLASIETADIVDVDSTPAAVNIHFGPAKRYTLSVPTPTKRQAISAPLPDTKQLPLPFEH